MFPSCFQLGKHYIHCIQVTPSYFFQAQMRNWQFDLPTAPSLYYEGGMGMWAPHQNETSSSAIWISLTAFSSFPAARASTTSRVSCSSSPSLLSQCSHCLTLSQKKGK